MAPASTSARDESYADEKSLRRSSAVAMLRSATHSANAVASSRSPDGPAGVSAARRMLTSSSPPLSRAPSGVSVMNAALFDSVPLHAAPSSSNARFTARLS